MWLLKMHTKSTWSFISNSVLSLKGIGTWLVWLQNLHNPTVVGNCTRLQPIGAVIMTVVLCVTNSRESGSIWVWSEYIHSGCKISVKKMIPKHWTRFQRQKASVHFSGPCYTPGLLLGLRGEYFKISIFAMAAKKLEPDNISVPVCRVTSKKVE